MSNSERDRTREIDAALDRVLDAMTAVDEAAARRGQARVMEALRERQEAVPRQAWPAFAMRTAFVTAVLVAGVALGVRWWFMRSVPTAWPGSSPTEVASAPPVAAAPSTSSTPSGPLPPAAGRASESARLGTARPDTAPRNTVPSDTVRRDTAPPDIARSDTGPSHGTRHDSRPRGAMMRDRTLRDRVPRDPVTDLAAGIESPSVASTSARQPSRATRPATGGAVAALTASGSRADRIELAPEPPIGDPVAPLTVTALRPDPVAAPEAVSVTPLDRLAIPVDPIRVDAFDAPAFSEPVPFAPVSPRSR